MTMPMPPPMSLVPPSMTHSHSELSTITVTPPTSPPMPIHAPTTSNLPTQPKPTTSMPPPPPHPPTSASSTPPSPPYTRTPTPPLTTNEILTHLLPFLTPVAIPLSWDLGDDAVLRKMFSDLLGDPMLFGSVDGGSMEKGAAQADMGREGELRRGGRSVKGKEKARESVGDGVSDLVQDEKGGTTYEVRVGFQDESSLPQRESTPRCDVSPDVGRESSLAPARRTARSVSRAISHPRSKSSTSQFSPVDWSKTTTATTRQGSVVLNLSPNAKLILGPPAAAAATQASASSPGSLQVLSTSLSVGGTTIGTTPPQAMAATRSYTLPPPMEGTIAALREVSLGTAYTDAYVYGGALSRDKKGFGVGSEDERREDQVDMVMGADAGERMLSPESEEEREELQEEEEEEEEEEKEEEEKEEERMQEEEEEEEEEEEKEEERMQEEEEEEEEEEKEEERMQEEEEEDESMEKECNSKENEVLPGSALTDMEPASVAPSTEPFTRENVIMQRTVSSTSSLSTLTSLTSTLPASSESPSVTPPSPEPGIRTSRSPSISIDHTPSAASPLIDMQNLKIGPPRKAKRLVSDSATQQSDPMATLPVSVTSSTKTMSSTTVLQGSQSQTTEEDEATVQDLVMVGSQDQEELGKIEDSMDTDHGNGVDGPVQEEEEEGEELTPVPSTPLQHDRNDIIPSNCSPPALEKGKGKALDRDWYDGEMEEDTARVSQPPPSQPGDSSRLPSPLFTSPSESRNFVDDASFYDNDENMDTSTPSRVKSKTAAGTSKHDSDEESETTRIVNAKRELSSPISVPAHLAQKYEYIPSASPSPNRITRSSKTTTAPKTTNTASTSKASASTSKPEVIEIDFDGPPKKTPRRKAERSNATASTSVISMSSGSEDEVALKATQFRPKTLSQVPPPKSATLENKSNRMRPRPIPEARRTSSVKFEIFSQPPPEVVDLTTPVRIEGGASTGGAATAGGSRKSPPPSPLAATVKAKLDQKKPGVENPSTQEKPTEEAPTIKGKETARAPEPVPDEYYSSPLSSAEELEVEKAPPPQSSPFDIAKATARIAELDDDDDADIIIVKKKKPVRKAPAPWSAPGAGSGSADPSKSTSGGVGAAGVKSDPDAKTAANATKMSRMAELLAAKGKKQSAAATRVKKRKRLVEASALANGDGDGDEEDIDNLPPLKRAKARSLAAATEREKEKLKEKEQEKGKEKTRETHRDSLRHKEEQVKVKEEGPSTRYPLRSPRKEPSIGSTSFSVVTPKRKRGQGLVWPKVANPNFDLLVKCDICETWYHIGCVGMVPDDVRLRDTELYECPMCASGIPKEQSPVKKLKDEDLHGSKAPCARPHCLLAYVNRRSKGRKSQPLENESSYIVEALVGRHKKVTGGLGITYEYLVKWLNYDYSEATVQTIESMGMSNPGPLLEAFEKQAVAEGINLADACDTILLREAAEAGWTDDLVFVSVK